MPYFLQFYKLLCIWVIVVWLWEYIFPFLNLQDCPSLFCDNPYLAVSAGVSLLGLFWAPITDYLSKWSRTPRNFKSLLISDCIVCFIAIDLVAKYTQIYYGQCFVRTLSLTIPFQFIEIAVLVIFIVSFSAARLKSITKLEVTEIPEPISSDRPISKYQLLLDEPIKKASEDTLGFRSAADVFANVIKENVIAPRSSSFTIGLTGRWGSGKTSFFNLLEDALQKQKLPIGVVRFCAPLPLSKVEVIEQFFNHIESAIRQKYLVPGLSTVLLRYKQLFSSLEGSFLKGLAAFTPRDEHSIRKSLEDLLQGISETFVVLVDDFDRFSEDGEEQRVLLWLLRMFSAMPQFVFVVAYDPQRVSRGTEERYIDKFIQLELPVPLSFDGKLAEQIVELIEAKKEKILQEERKRIEEFAANSRLRIATLRDSKKFRNALIPVIASMGDLSPSDVVAVHYLRLYYPEVFQALMQRRHLLLKESQSNYQALIELLPFLSDGENPKSNPRDLLLAEVLKPIDLLESSSLKNIIDLVFPDGGGSLVNSELTGRLAISANLDKYLSYTEFASDANVFYIEKFLNSFLSPDVAVETRASKLTAFLEKFPTLGYPLNLILESKHHEIRSLLHSKRLLFGESLARASNILVAQILGNGSFIEAHIARAVFDAVRLELPDQYSKYLTERAREGASSPFYLASLVKEFSIDSSFANIYQNNREQLTEFFNEQVESFAKFKNCGIDDYPDAFVRGVILSQLALSISLSGLSEDEKERHRARVRETLHGLLEDSPQDFNKLIKLEDRYLLALFTMKPRDWNTDNLPYKFFRIYQSQDQLKELIQKVEEAGVGKYQGWSFPDFLKKQCD